MRKACALAREALEVGVLLDDLRAWRVMGYPKLKLDGFFGGNSHFNGYGAFQLVMGISP